MTPFAESTELFQPNQGQNSPKEDPSEDDQLQDDQPYGGPRTYGEFNRDLPEELQRALLGLLHEAQREDLYQRRIEVMGDRQRRFYERGIQHIYEDISGAFVLSSPGQVVPDPTSPGNSVQCGQFVNNYNIFGRALQIIIAKLTENPPGVVFEPDSGDNSVDEQASTAAEAFRVLFERWNDVKDITTAIVRMMGLSGRTVSWTRTVADKQRWGVDQNGEPRKCQTTSIFGTLETKCPIIARSLGECPYFIITEDPHLYMAKMEHPYFRDDIVQGAQDGVADTQFERLARIGVLQGQSNRFQVTDAYNFYVEDRNVWFRPAMFMSKCLDSTYTDQDEQGNTVQLQNEDGDAWTLRDALTEAFPDGCRVEFIGSQYVGSKNECMDDCLAMDFPYAGEGASRMAIMFPAVPIQDDFNDDMNNYHEVKVTGWPSTWIHEEYANLKFINDQEAAPYCFRSLKSRPPRDAKMSEQFYREPDPMIPPSFMEHTEYMATQLLQFILAIPSAVQGAGMPDQKTKGGYQEAINQAMGQLGVIFGAVQRIYSKIIRQAALCASKDSQDADKTIMVPSRKGAVPLNMADLGKGHFLCHPDEDSGYPESTMQKRATLQSVFELAFKDPVIAQALLQSPNNWDFIFRTFGISELTIPEAVVRRKQLAEIEILLQQSPIGPAPEEIEEAQAQHAAAVMQAQATGQPAPPPFDPSALPMHSSIQPGVLDYHEWEFEECKEFLSDWAKVQQQIAAGNQEGLQNVLLHAQEHQAQMAAQAQQQAAALAAMHPAVNVAGKLASPVEPAAPSQQPQPQAA